MLVYRLLTILLSPLIIGYFLWLTIINRQGRYVWQRLGFDYFNLPEGSLWFHCASVGEVNTLLPLLERLHADDETLKIIITTNTITGGKIVEQQVLDYLHHCYLPFDWTYSINNFLNRTRPSALYIMETEIWPNLFTQCNKHGIPISIINARLSHKTLSANAWVRQLLRATLAKVSAIYARSSRDAESYILLGADEKKVKAAGNLKATTILSPPKTEENIVPSDRDYVLLASTHEDEESQIYEVWKKMQRKELLLIAPRHPERRSSILKQLSSKNIAVRSKNQPITADTEVYLLDTVGELKNYFSRASVVIMGGSFVPVGGHNVMEPASRNSAIITGPYMDNFREELDLMLEQNAIIYINSKLQSCPRLKEHLTKLLDDQKFRESIQNNTTQLSQDVEKILDNYVALITGDTVE